MSTGPAPSPSAAGTAADTSGDTALPPPNREVLIELLCLHARALRRMPWVETVLVLGMALFMYPYIPPLLFVGWGALTIGVEAGRARYATSVLRRASTIDPVRTHFNVSLLEVADQAITLIADHHRAQQQAVAIRCRQDDDHAV